jgi:hypothetical protein
VLNFLFTSRNVGVRSKPPKNSRIGIVSPAITSAYYALKMKPNGRTSHRCTIHNFEFRDGLALIILVGRRTRSFPSYDGELHVFDFYTDKKEVDLSNDDVLEVISVSNHIRICLCCNSNEVTERNGLE